MSINKEDTKNSPTAWYSVRLGFLLNTKENQSAGSGEEIILKFQEMFFDETGLLDHACTGLWTGLWENFVRRIRHGLVGKHWCGRFLSCSVRMGKSLAVVRSIKGGLKL